jgi:hypothetical protein
LFFEDRPLFFEQLIKEIGSLIRKAERENLIPAVRLNGTSDIQWEKIRYKNQTIFGRFPDLQFYDYTKIPNRKTPLNYDLTFSLSESNEKHARNELSRGRRVAVVFRNELPSTFWSVPVVDGDTSDIRFNDPDKCIVGLKAKGTAKYDDTGFVR